MRVAAVLSLLAGIQLCFGAVAKHRVVVEVNVSGTLAYNIVLGNVKNLVKAFGPGNVDVEIVCEGAGIDMLLLSSKIAPRVKAMHGLGVTFVACGNTVRGRHIPPSSMPDFVKVVPAGVAEVVLKQEAGWSYLKGAY